MGLPQEGLVGLGGWQAPCAGAEGLHGGIVGSELGSRGSSPAAAVGGLKKAVKAGRKTVETGLLGESG